MDIIPFTAEHLPEMAALFTENFAQLRAQVPILPDTLADLARVATMFSELFDSTTGLVALDKGEVVGYLGWYWVDEFRGTPRKGAYVPEWAHGALAARRYDIYRALYQVASRLWIEGGCGVHAISLLAHDKDAQHAWFWNGFGLTGVDAIRPITPVETAPPAGITVRRATLDDVDALVALEVAHARHYLEAPVSMLAHDLDDAATIAEALGQPHGSKWLAFDGTTPIGFLSFAVTEWGASAIVNANDKIAINGAFVRLAYRGRKAAPALLNAGLRYYTEQGFTRCSVDFEGFNPQAAAFWPRYFDVVTLSLTRIPERAP